MAYFVEFSIFNSILLLYFQDPTYATVANFLKLEEKLLKRNKTLNNLKKLEDKVTYIGQKLKPESTRNTS